jgi:hypothetical protein
MYVQATFFPPAGPDLDSGNADDPGAGACPVPRPSAPSDPDGQAEFVDHVLPLIKSRARRMFFRKGMRGGAAALEDLVADSNGVAWLRWLRSRDTWQPAYQQPPHVLVHYAVLSALCGMSVCGRQKRRPTVELQDTDCPSPNHVPTVDIRLDSQAWLKTLPPDLLYVAVVLMHTPRGRQVATGSGATFSVFDVVAFSAARVRLAASWRAFNR